MEMTLKHKTYGLSLETNGIRHISWFVAAVPGKVGRLNHLDKEQSRYAR